MEQEADELVAKYGTPRRTAVVADSASGACSFGRHALASVQLQQAGPDRVDILAVLALLYCVFSPYHSTIRSYTQARWSCGKRTSSPTPPRSSFTPAAAISSACGRMPLTCSAWVARVRTAMLTAKHHAAVQSRCLAVCYEPHKLAAGNRAMPSFGMWSQEYDGLVCALCATN